MTLLSTCLGLVCDINAMSRLVPSLFLSLTLSPVRPLMDQVSPYLWPITSIHLSIASNSIQCILRMSTLRLAGPAQVFIGALAFKTICWKRGSVNMWREPPMVISSLSPSLHPQPGSNYVITEAITGPLTFDSLPGFPCSSKLRLCKLLVSKVDQNF